MIESQSRPYQAAAHHRIVLDRLQAGVVIHDATTAIVYANAAACHLLGVRADDIAGILDSDDRWHIVDERGVRLTPAQYPVNRVIASGCAVTNEILGVPSSTGGGMTWLLCTAYPLDGHDVPGGVVVVSFTDVTELKHSERQLRLSDERLRLVLEGSRDAPWDYDLVSSQLYYSDRWWEMLGLDVDCEPADTDLWRRHLHPADCDRVDRTFAAILASDASSYEIEFRLQHRDGHYVPVSSRGHVTRAADGTPLRVSGINSDLTERKAIEHQITQLAFYDPLTGLPNRRLFMEQMQKAMLMSKRDGRHGALLFIDLDDFKRLNDTCGHEVGDQLLRAVATRLTDYVRTTDTVARLGGDEFLIMLEGLAANRHDAAIEAERIGANVLLALDTPYRLDSGEYHSTASIGIALFGDESATVEGVLKQADLAMYTVKSKGRNGLHHFDSGVQCEVDERLVLESEVRRALTRDELCLYLEPRQSTGCGIVGSQAVLRWQHPMRGLLEPAAFLAIAEASGLIVPLGNWLLRKACRQLACWSAHERARGVSLAVDVSVRHFRESDFALDLLELLAHSGADPVKLTLELSESVLTENLRDVGDKMSALKARGVRFSLVQFGAGSCSLRSLQRLPFDELKIDRSFVRGAPESAADAAIARVVLGVGTELGLTVVADGVETAQQHAMLLHLGYRSFAGSFFGAPQAADAFDRRILGITGASAG